MANDVEAEYQAFDWSNKQWNEYATTKLFPMPPPEKLEVYKRRWFKKNIDSSLIVDSNSAAKGEKNVQDTQTTFMNENNEFTSSSVRNNSPNTSDNVRQRNPNPTTEAPKTPCTSDINNSTSKRTPYSYASDYIKKVQEAASTTKSAPNSTARPPSHLILYGHFFLLVALVLSVLQILPIATLLPVITHYMSKFLYIMGFGFLLFGKKAFPKNLYQFKELQGTEECQLLFSLMSPFAMSSSILVLIPPSILTIIALSKFYRSQQQYVPSLIRSNKIVMEINNLIVIRMEFLYHLKAMSEYLFCLYVFFNLMRGIKKILSLFYLIGFISSISKDVYRRAVFDNMHSRVIFLVYHRNCPLIIRKVYEEVKNTYWKLSTSSR